MEKVPLGAMKGFGRTRDCAVWAPASPLAAVLRGPQIVQGANVVAGRDAATLQDPAGEPRGKGQPHAPRRLPRRDGARRGSGGGEERKGAVRCCGLGHGSKAMVERFLPRDGGKTFLIKIQPLL